MGNGLIAFVIVGNIIIGPIEGRRITYDGWPWRSEEEFLSECEAAPRGSIGFPGNSCKEKLDLS